MWTIVESSAGKTAHLPEFDEPLILNGGPGEEIRTSAHWLKLLVYLAGCIILLACLLAQLFYFNQHYFLRHSFWRPLMASACEQLECALPAEKNAAALRSVFLTVDPHPEYQDMLLATFRIQNSARYPQAFPAVELLFSNTGNKPVAARRFYPGQYLDPAATAQGFIAAGGEINGALEISSPGEDAINYTLEFVYENN